MGLKTRTFGVVAGVALVAGAWGAVPGGAATPLPDAVGSIHCTVKGALKFNPPLVAGGTVSTTVTLATTEVGCAAAGNATNITGGSSKNSHVSDTNDCLTVLTQPFQASSGQIKWKVPTGTQKWSPSTINFTSGSQSGDGESTPYTIDTSGNAGPTGSFAGDTVMAHAQIKQTKAQITAKCIAGISDPTMGLKSLTIISPQSTFDASAPAG